MFENIPEKKREYKKINWQLYSFDNIKGLIHLDCGTTRTLQGFILSSKVSFRYKGGIGNGLKILNSFSRNYLV